MNLREMTEEEVLALLKTTKNSRALGPDDLQSDLLKKSSKYTISALTHLVNLSIWTKLLLSSGKMTKSYPYLRVGRTSVKELQTHKSSESNLKTGREGSGNPSY